MIQNLKSFIKEKLCVEKQADIGPIAILLCDLMLSFNLKGPDVILENSEGEKENLGPSISYGITIEPFALHLMGRDGDVCWTSPRWSLLDWACKKASSDDRKRFQNVSQETIANTTEYSFQLGT